MLELHYTYGAINFYQVNVELNQGFSFKFLKCGNSVLKPFCETCIKLFDRWNLK